MNYLLFKRWNDFSGWLVFLIAAFGIVLSLFHAPKSYRSDIRLVHLFICW